MKIRVAIVGYGNIGKYALQALEAAPDMECVGIVRSSADRCTPEYLRKTPELSGYKVVTDIAGLGQVDVAILSTPSRSVGENARKYLMMGINTVDSFDIHSDICSLRHELNPIACKGAAVSIVSAGWDPGTDSIVRALMEGMTPSGTTYTNFGPGRSMGHSVAAASKSGVARALSMTIPVGNGVHRREVFVELEDGADFSAVERAIKEDPYFINDETVVKQVESVAAIDTHMHGVKLERGGVSGSTEGQRLEFNMRINNPALTGQVLVMAARATMRQSPGCYTMIEVPVVDFLAGNREENIKKLV